MVRSPSRFFVQTARVPRTYLPAYIGWSFFKSEQATPTDHAARAGNCYRSRCRYTQMSTWKISMRSKHAMGVTPRSKLDRKIQSVGEKYRSRLKRGADVQERYKPQRCFGETASESLLGQVSSSVARAAVRIRKHGPLLWTLGFLLMTQGCMVRGLQDEGFPPGFGCRTP